VSIEFNAIAQVITASGASTAAILTALSKFLPVWRMGRTQMARRKGQRRSGDPSLRARVSSAKFDLARHI